MAQQCLEKGDNTQEIISDLEVPEKHPTPVMTEKKIDTAYIIDLINKDNYIFDVRCWPGGITAQEFFSRWNNNWEDVKPWWNAGHFAYACRVAKKHYAADPELIWEVIVKRKVDALTALVSSWTGNTMSHLETAKEYDRRGDFAFRDTWIGHAIKSWESVNLCLKELGKAERPMPEELQKYIDETRFGGS